MYLNDARLYVYTCTSPALFWSVIMASVVKPELSPSTENRGYTDASDSSGGLMCFWSCNVMRLTLQSEI